MFMRATVLEVNKDGLLVRDNETEQDVIVHTSCVCRIRVNDRVGIVYNGSTKVVPFCHPKEIKQKKLVLVGRQSHSPSDHLLV